MPLDTIAAFLDALPGGFVIQRNRDLTYTVALMQRDKSIAMIRPTFQEAMTACLEHVGCKQVQ